MSTETSPDRTGVCAWCEHENAPGSRFCGNCGRTLVFDVVCPFCNHENPEENAHCDACGVFLDESKRVEPRGTRYFDRLRERFNFFSWPFVILAGIIALALFIRLFSLTDIPPNLVPDEADNLITVYRIMADIGPGFFELDWKPQPAFSAYMMGWFMGVFGETIVGMRMASVVAEHRVHLGVLRRRPPAGCRQTRKSRGHVPAWLPACGTSTSPGAAGRTSTSGCTRSRRCWRSMLRSGANDMSAKPAALRRDGVVRSPGAVRVHQRARDHRRPASSTFPFAFFLHREDRKQLC